MHGWLRPLGLHSGGRRTVLSTHFHKYGNVCWERDGAQIEEQQRDGPVPPQPFGRKEVAGDLFVSRRRRCPCIASSSLRELALQAPSANVIVFMKGSTKSQGPNQATSSSIASV